MPKGLVAHASVFVNSSPARVWAALTDPSLIKEYFFGADIVTTWAVGSPILYRGQWQGKPYEDKGTVLEFEPEKRLVTTHWSALSGVPDIPENYHTVAYDLRAQGEGTRVSLSQDNNASEDEVAHSGQNWQAVLQALKQLLET